MVKLYTKAESNPITIILNNSEKINQLNQL